MKKLLEKTLANIYSESEVLYVITLLKKKQNLEQSHLKEIFEKGSDTLEVLMCKLGLKDQFVSVMEQYEQDLKTNQRDTLLKQMFRCK